METESVLLKQYSPEEQSLIQLAQEQLQEIGDVLSDELFLSNVNNRVSQSLDWVGNSRRFLYSATINGGLTPEYTNENTWSIIQLSEPYPDGSMEMKCFFISYDPENIFELCLRVTRHDHDAFFAEDGLDVVNEDIALQDQLGLTEPTFEEIAQLAEAIHEFYHRF